jgi:hypothetical protein
MVRRHILFDFSHTFAFFTLPVAHSIRFFVYIYLLYVTVGTFYSIFRIHLPSLCYRRHILFDFSHLLSLRYRRHILFDFSHLLSLRYWRHILFDFSHTSAFFTLPEAHSIRFFAYIWLIQLTSSTFHSIFRIHLAHSTYR